MKLFVEKSRLHGRVLIPASKSHTIRAVAIASMACGTSIIRNPLISEDAVSSVRAFISLGAQIDSSDNTAWKIIGNSGKIFLKDDTIDVGNSGTTIRLATACAALAEPGKKVILTGDEQIQSRGIKPLADALTTLGAKCKCIKGNDNPPVEVQGKIRGGKASIECVTSQYLSALLIAAPLAENDTEIEVPLLNEPDYVQITLDWLDKQNIKYQNNGLKWFKIEGGQSYKAFDETICADFSSATFFLCAAAITGGEIEITNLDFNDSQPDKAVADYLSQMGAKVSRSSTGVKIKGDKLHGIQIDMNRTPDALPAMAATAAFAEGITRLVNVPQARRKETDRIRCMAEELAKMQIKTEELPDGLIIHGGNPRPAVLDGRGDHRIVMADAIAALGIEGQTIVKDAEAMNVTFPSFVSLMRSIGAEIKQE